MEDFKRIIDGKESIKQTLETTKQYLLESSDRLLISKEPVEIHTKKQPTKPKKSVPTYLLDKFKNANSIIDPDIRLSTIKKIIEEYGLFTKPNIDAKEPYTL